MANDHELSGTWHLTYWYPSNKHDGEDPSEYDGSWQQQDGKYIFESTTNPDKSYIFVRMVINDGVGSGTWQESTAPEGEYKGAIYNASFQALLNDANDSLDGMWVGDGNDHGTKKIYTGRVEIKRVG